MKDNPAFTLIELLVSISIIAVLSALLLSAFKGVQSSADRTEAMSKMRQVGIAVQSFAADNDGSLPGPLWVGQSPWYNSGDTHTLGYQLWNYIGAPAPQTWTQEAKTLSPKAYERVRPSTGTMSIVVNQAITINGANCLPWGYQSGSTQTPPLKMATLASAGLTSTWAMQDADQTNKIVANMVPPPSWYSTLPSQPIYKPCRLTLYFDWHIVAEKIQ